MHPDDQQFLEQFETCTLDPATFDHRAHLRIAWIYISNNDAVTACCKTCEGIRRFATYAGDTDKFHHTITEFLVRTMGTRLVAKPQTDFEGFISSNPDILADARGLLEQSYRMETLLSEAAKSRWVAPDLAA